jgi:Fur family ferric uptake transcriptional regulator
MERGRALLQAANARVTAPRLAVLGALATSPRPLSHGEVLEALRGQPWDQATLYRNLLKLVELGLARVATDVGGLIRYEATLGALARTHPHFVCKHCGKIECMPSVHVTLPIDETGWSSAVRCAQVQLVGVCPSCAS